MAPRRVGGAMKQVGVLLSAVALFGCRMACASPFGALMKSEAALKKASSWHVVMQISGGNALTMDYSAPHRWRVVLAPDRTEVIIGNAVYMDTAGHVTQLPAAYAAPIARAVRIRKFDAPTLAQVRRTARDLGAQTLDGKPVHVYRYVANGATDTWYIGSRDLPMRVVIQSDKGTQVVRYSRFNVPVSIQLPTG